MTVPVLGGGWAAAVVAGYQAAGDVGMSEGRPASVRGIGSGSHGWLSTVASAVNLPYLARLALAIAWLTERGGPRHDRQARLWRAVSDGYGSPPGLPAIAWLVRGDAVPVWAFVD